MDKFQERVSRVISSVVEPELEEIRRLFLTGTKRECDPQVLKALCDQAHLIGDIKTEVKTIESLVRQAHPRASDQYDYYHGDNPREKFIEQVHKWYDTFFPSHDPDTDDSLLRHIIGDLLGRDGAVDKLMDKDGELVDTVKSALINGAITGLLRSLIDKVINNSRSDVSAIISNVGARVDEAVKAMVEAIQSGSLAIMQREIARTTNEIWRHLNDLDEQLADQVSQILRKVEQYGQQAEEEAERAKSRHEDVMRALETCCLGMRENISSAVDELTQNMIDIVGTPERTNSQDGEIRQRLNAIYNEVVSIRGLL